MSPGVTPGAAVRCNNAYSSHREEDMMSRNISDLGVSLRAVLRRNESAEREWEKTESRNH